MAALIELLVQDVASRWTCGAHPNDKALGFGGPVGSSRRQGCQCEHRSLRRSSQVQNDWCDARMTRDGAIGMGGRPPISPFVSRRRIPILSWTDAHIASHGP